MLVSYKWLREISGVDVSVEELTDTLTMLGLEVEEVTDLSKKYDGFITGEVLTCESHPNADKLSVCTVSTGEEVKNVVCGAPNVAAGQKIVFGQIGAVVPKAGFALDKRKIRGIASEGMICSQDELEMGEDHSGIWVLDENTPLGKPISQYFNVDDIIIELSVTPNRADCLSHIGVARDIAAKYGKSIKIPEINLNETGNDVHQLAEVEIVDDEKCKRYAARVIEGVKIVESPDWIKSRLTNIGLRPINIAVDVTNLVLMECGQPLHAFDLDELAGNKIVVKTVADKTKFTTLDDKERELDSDMLMICDAEKPVAVGGVMGGQNSEISDKTVNILIESAYFNPSSVRKTSKKLAIQSDSSYRFERGVDINMVTYALDRAAELINKYAGGTMAQGAIDIYPNIVEQKKCEIRFDRAAKVIGAKVETNKIEEILNSLGFETVEIDDSKLLVSVPSWRVDVEEEVDLIEEIARFVNYNKIDAKFISEIDFSDTVIPERLSVPQLREESAQYFVNNGFNEIVTQNQLDRTTAGLFTDDPVKIANPLGEELSNMKPSVIPSTLRVVKYNHNKGNKDLTLFELGKSFRNVSEKTKTYVEGYQENEELVIAISGKREPKQWGLNSEDVDFFDIKGIVEQYLEYLNIAKFRFKQNTDLSIFSANSLEIVIDKKPCGVLGSINKKMKKHFDIEHEVFIANINMAAIYNATKTEGIYRKVSPYPTVERDLAFICDEKVTSDDIFQLIERNGGNLLKNVVLFDKYEGESLGEGKKSLAYSLYFSSIDKTLKDAEVDQTINKIVKNIESKLDVNLRKS